MIGLKRGTVQLMIHQAEWITEAENTIKELKCLFGDTAIDVQHIGSTAIPSIHAKPIIDIVVGVRKPDDVRPYMEALEEKGFIFHGEDVPGQLLFVKGSLEKDFRTHHIHVVKWDGNEWNNYINFRDYLNAFPEKARIYDNCKQRLAVRFPADRKSYTEGKKDLVNAFLEEARLWRAGQ